MSQPSLNIDGIVGAIGTVVYSNILWEQIAAMYVEKFPVKVNIIYKEQDGYFIDCSLSIELVQNVLNSGFFKPTKMVERFRIELEDLLHITWEGKPLLIDNDPRKERLRDVMRACGREGFDKVHPAYEIAMRQSQSMVEYVYLQILLVTLGIAVGNSRELLHNVAVLLRFGNSEKVEWEDINNTSKSRRVG